MPLALDLEQQFPGAVAADRRAGYGGYIVAADKLVEVAAALRAQAGYTYLTSATAVDYLEQNLLEMVYHLYRPEGGPALVLKAQTPRDAAVLPSLVPVFPGADLQEREAWDLMGIRFTNHPDLRRILLWEDFVGHPLRKDWKEPYYEAEAKPLDSRWPIGDVTLAEDKNPYHHNVQYPAGFNPDGWTPEGETKLYGGLSGPDASGNVATDEFIINFGPQHPSTHGVFRMAARLDGETIMSLRPVMGYLHRCHEKIGERGTFLHSMPFTDRLDYFCSMSNNLGYALAVEKLMGVKPPERAEYIRVLMVELTRILNHFTSIGFFLNDLGAYFTPVLYAFNERERILDIFEAASGARMMCNYMRFGGVVRDIPPETLAFARELVFERLPRQIDEYDALLTGNEILQMRCIDVGKISAPDAIAYGLSGPVLRATGVPYDIRRAEPYSIYDRFDFNIALGANGDSYDRYLVRIAEMRESLKILRQVLDQMPGGPVMTGKPQYQARVPAGEAYGRIESPKGELGFYIVSNGKQNPYRYHVRAPSLVNLTALNKMCVGHKIADVMVILGSIDIVLGELDR